VVDRLVRDPPQRVRHRAHPPLGVRERRVHREGCEALPSSASTDRARAHGRAGLGQRVVVAGRASSSGSKPAHAAAGSVPRLWSRSAHARTRSPTCQTYADGLQTPGAARRRVRSLEQRGEAGPGASAHAPAPPPRRAQPGEPALRAVARTCRRWGASPPRRPAGTGSSTDLRRAPGSSPTSRPAEARAGRRVRVTPDPAAVPAPRSGPRRSGGWRRRRCPGHPSRDVGSCRSRAAP
jgi:hypothetical protein